MFEFIKKLLRKPVSPATDFQEFTRMILQHTAIPEPSQEDVERRERAYELGHRLFKISSTCNSMAEWLRNVRAMEAETGWKVPSPMWVRASQDAMASCRLAGTRAKAKIDKHMSNGGRIARASRIATRNTARIRPPTTNVTIHG